MTVPAWLQAFALSLLRWPDGWVRKVGNCLETTGTPPGGAGATTLDGLSDVVAPAPSAGQVLTYNAGSGTWGPA